MAKSVYLSAGRFAGAEEPTGWQSRLKQLQLALKSGHKIEYEQAELTRIAATKETLRRVPDAAVCRAVLRFFLPGIIFLALIWILVWVLRSLHR
jgi:hypothetical protein